MLRTGFQFAGILAVGFATSTSYPTTALAGPECTCRYQGHNYQVGDLVCLRSPKGIRLAVCGMVLNNTSWEITDNPCPSAQLTPIPQNIQSVSPFMTPGHFSVKT